MIQAKELSENIEAKSVTNSEELEAQLTCMEIKESVDKVNFWLDNQIDKSAKNDYNIEDSKPHPITKLTLNVD